MSAWSIDLDHEELNTVWRIFCRSLNVETQTDGLWVRTVNGRRVWSGTCGPLTWEVTGEASDVSLAPLCLPARLVWNAADLAFEADDRTVTIHSPDGIVGVANSTAGESVIDLPHPGELPSFPNYVTDQARVTLTRRELSLLFGRISFVPTGLEHPNRVPVTLIVESGRLAATADWSREGGLRTTQRVAATTAGEGSATVPLVYLSDLIREVDDDENITIRFPEDPDVPLLIEGADWRATSARRESDALRFHEQLGQALANATGTTTRTLDRGVFSATWRDRTIRVELHNTPTDTVRLSTVVIDTIEPTVEVLQQLNDVNAGLIGARVWLCEQVVVAGVDVPCSAIDDIGAVIRQLDAQIDGLDVFLAALGAEAV
jgi:hypothetical protein